MKYRIVLVCFMSAAIACSDMKEHVLPLELGNTQRDPFVWSTAKGKESSKEIIQEEPIVNAQLEPEVRVIEKPAWRVFGAATTKRDAYALLRDGDHQRLVEAGADVGGGWRVSEITTHKIMYVHETGEQWIVGV